MNDISIFDGTMPLMITKPIRLIECFAGYGSQALALRYLGVPFEHYAISEWAVKSIQAYKDMHMPEDNTPYDASYTNEEIRKMLKGKISADYNNPIPDEKIDKMPIGKLREIVRNMIATHNHGSIVGIKGSDIRIEDKDKYTYLLTYSFPCQDISAAGLQKGMSRDSGTRSGMLWQVERLLLEWQEIGEMPDILLMENVPEVCGTKNEEPWKEWLNFLEKMGYKNYYRIINATEFGIPQNRRRCFMVSVLGDYYYDFPHPMGCQKRLLHILEPKVDESYYLSDEMVAQFVRSQPVQVEREREVNPIASVPVEQGHLTATCGMQ